MPKTIENIIVVGSGQMGSGIAQVAATSGFHVHLYDQNVEALEKAKSGMLKSLTKLFEKEKIAESPTEVFKRLSFVEKESSLPECNADLLIEAIVENLDIKKQFFAKMDELLDSSCLFASNTSSISITKLAASTKRADKFIGMHFMNPVPIMKLVEVICGLETSDDTHSSVVNAAEKMGKVLVTSQDRPGFIINRILMPMINEACYVLQEGIATAKDIDAGMKLGTNQPMGPLTLADFIGLDTCLAIMKVLNDGLGDTKYRPAPLLQQYVDAGRLGRKSGRGFYEYNS